LSPYHIKNIKNRVLNVLVNYCVHSNMILKQEFPNYEVSTSAANQALTQLTIKASQHETCIKYCKQRGKHSTLFIKINLNKQVCGYGIGSDNSAAMDTCFS
ncbi:hypothetical protein ACJX0J_037992, partial [Zea mays]